MLRLLPAKKLRYTFKTKPFSHQKRALAKIQKRNGRLGLFMEMGTGKTKVAIDWAGIGFYNHGVRRVLVVAPISVHGVWPRQIRQHSGAPARIFRLSGNTRTRVKALSLILRSPVDDKLTYIIINYEGLWRQPDRGPGVEALIRKWHPDLVVFDESHRIKSPTSKQSKSAWRIARESDQCLILTGTPITRAPLDVFGQFRALNHHVFGENWYQFKFTYGVWGGFGKHQLFGIRNLPDLIEKVRAWTFRIKKKQCLDLPEKLFVDVPVTLSDRGYAIYREMAKKMIVEIEETHALAQIVVVKLLRLSQITSGFVKDVDKRIRIFDDSKLRVCMDLLDDLLEEGQKVIIYAKFIPDIDRIGEKLIDKGIGHRILSGSVPDRKRDSIVQDFQTKPDVKVFVAQLQTGSEGIELFAGSAVIYYSMGNSALHYWQSQDRAHRPGQTKNVTYYRLIVPGSYDVVQYKALDAKEKVANVVIHDPYVLNPNLGH